MQRVRAGLTGLAAIFLMVLIAAAGMKPRHPMTPNGAHQGETLAVLGVAPGSAAEDARRDIARRPSQNQSVNADGTIVKHP